MKQLLLCTIVLATACFARHVGNADAIDWAKTFYPDATHITARCQEFDTDQNGYVSCTAKVDDTLVALECPVNKDVGCQYRNTECRLARGNAAAN